MKKFLALVATIAALTLTGSTATLASSSTKSPSSNPSTKVDPQLNWLSILDCNDFAYTFRFETIEKAPSKNDGTVKLQCGTKKGFGYVHIRHHHEDDWTKAKKGAKGNWDDEMWVATKSILKNPAYTRNQGDNKRCYTGRWKITTGSGKKEEYYPTVIVSINNHTVITSYPTREHSCAP